MSIKKEIFGTTKDGKVVNRYILENKNGMKAAFLDLGAVITSIIVPDREGHFDDVVHGYDTVQAYEVNEPSFGAPVGRCANRISDGHFFIRGREYHLDQNDKTNCLHSGYLRFNHLMYETEYEKGDGEEVLVFSRLSPDGEQHFPGNFDYSITYRLNDLDELVIEYDGVCDQDTIVNMTNHSYFNLGVGGHKGKTILDHEVKIFSNQYTPVNDLLYPTGEICDVTGTPFDFREFKRLGTDVVSDVNAPDYFKGYDHNFILNHEKGEVVEAAICRAPSTGRELVVLTDQPGVQMYTAPELSGEKGKDGAVYGTSSAVCFETQNFPNAINTPGFPDSVLPAGKPYRHFTVFRFGTYDK
jgi:aldose 1-epimerase